MCALSVEDPHENLILQRILLDSYAFAVEKLAG